MKCPLCEKEKGSAQKCPHCNWKTYEGFPNEAVKKAYDTALKEAREKRKLELQPTPLPLKEVETPYSSSDTNTYTLDWGTNHPGHIVYLIDFSGSMNNDYKIKMVENTFNELSKYLISACSDDDDNDDGKLKVKDRLSIKIIGYNNDIHVLFDGSIKELNTILKSQSSSSIPIFEKLGHKVDPRGKTYTEKAFKAAKEDIENWIKLQREKRKSQPAPVVIHITDGYPEEVNPNYPDEDLPENETIAKALRAAEEIKNIKVRDGNALLFNIHITGNKNAKPLTFPTMSPDDTRRKFLFEASSIVPMSYRLRAPKDLVLEPNSRFMASNESDESKIIRLIQFGSSPARGDL